MNKSIRLIIFLFLSSLTLLKGQRPDFTFIGDKEGLIGNYQWSINSVAIDKLGFVWFCTMQGLNRWDGYSIKSYDKVSYNGRDLTTKNISAIAVDNDNNIWLGSQEEGIIHFDTKKEIFTPFESDKYKKGLKLTQINALIIDENNVLYIASAFQGVHKYDINKDSFSSYTDLNKKVGKAVNHMLMTKNGKLLVLAYNGAYYENETGKFTFYAIDRENYMAAMAELPDQKFILYSFNRFIHFILDVKNNTLEKFDNVSPNYVHGTAIDDKKNLWTSYNMGDFIQENILTKKAKSYYIRTKVNEQNVTIGMKGMVHHNDKMYFMSIGAGAGYFTTNDPLFSPFLDAGFGNLKHVNGKLYATKEDSLFIIEEGKKRLLLTLYKEKVNNYIIGYVITDDKGIFVTHIGQYGYMSHFDRHGKPKGSPIICNGPNHIMQLKNQRIVGNNQSIGYKSATGYPIDFVGDIYTELSKKTIDDVIVKYYREMKNGEVWIAPMYGGVIRIYDHLSKYEEMPIDKKGNGKLNSDNSYYIYEHSSGAIFVSTDLGINVWDPETKSFEFLQLPNMANNKTLKGMVEDKKGRLWILYDDRFLCYDVIKKKYYTMQLGDYYRNEEGVFKDLVCDDTGRIYFPTFNGIHSFDPDRFFETPAPNDILITDLYVKRARLYPNDEFNILSENILTQTFIDVPYQYRDLGFSFVSLEGKERDVTYFYRLKGYDDQWILTPDRTIHFTNLDPGEYQFEVKGVAGNGKETPKIKSLTITVQPPWYQRWYAYLLYTALLSSIAYVTYRIRIRQLIKYQNLRTKISSDLHDDVGTILTGIAMQSEMMSYQRENEDKSLLLDLSAMSRDAMERMRDIVWALDARKDSYDDLIARMREYAETTLGRKDIQYSFDIQVSTGLKTINPEQRQNLYLIFKEALTNIIKHSNANEVTITLHRSVGESILIIADNGSNPKSASMVSGQGLSNMRMRANRIGGSLDIDTKNGYSIIVKFNA